MVTRWGLLRPPMITCRILGMPLLCLVALVSREGLLQCLHLAGAAWSVFFGIGAAHLLWRKAYVEKLAPQEQVPVALGLLKTNPPLSRSSL